MAFRWIEDKRQWRRYKTRVAHLPAGHREATEALERYLLWFGPGKGTAIMAMLEDLADLFEQAAADRTPVHEVVGDDPVDFAETFLRNYPEGGWITKERDRLAAAIARAEEQGR